MKIQQTKNQKPIEYDIHFKYLCSCGQFHWLTYNETTTKNFFIVCDCNKKIKIKTIDSIKIKYKKKKKKEIISDTKDTIVVSDHTIQESNETPAKTEQPPVKITEETKIVAETQSLEIKDIPQELLSSCINLLYTFGYNKKDASELVKDFYKTHPVNEYKTFVNNLLASIKG
jgi:hypothetical protein